MRIVALQRTVLVAVLQRPEAKQHCWESADVHTLVPTTRATDWRLKYEVEKQMPPVHVKMTIDLLSVF